mgnify:CR=1 FL=1
MSHFFIQLYPNPTKYDGKVFRKKENATTQFQVFISVLFFVCSALWPEVKRRMEGLARCNYKDLGVCVTTMVLTSDGNSEYLALV